MGPEAPASTMRWDGIGKLFLRVVVCIAAVLVVTAALYEVPLRDRSLTAALIYIFVVIASEDVDREREPTIKSGRQNHDLLISVTDTGSGLPVLEAEKIFDAFFTSKTDGTGMGLSISRSIVESHGGHLWAMNNTPRGATFHFTLPTNVEAHDDKARGRSDRVHY